MKYELVKLAEEKDKPHAGDFALGSAKEFGTSWGRAGAEAGAASFVLQAVLMKFLSAMASGDENKMKSIIKSLKPKDAQELFVLLKKAGVMIGKPAAVAAGTGTVIGTAASYIPYAIHEQQLNKQADDREERMSKGLGAGAGVAGGAGLGALIASGKLTPEQILSPKIQEWIRANRGDAIDGAKELASQYKGPVIGGAAVVGGLAGLGFGSAIHDTSGWLNEHIEQPSDEIRHRVMADHGLEEDISETDAIDLSPQVRGALVGGAMGAFPAALDNLKSMKKGRLVDVKGLAMDAIRQQGGLLNPAIQRTLKVGLPFVGAGIGAAAAPRDEVGY